MSSSPRPVGRAVVIYTGLRFALFVGFLVLCLLLRLSTPLALVIALIASAIASFLLLRERRDQFVVSLQERSARRHAAREQRRAALDEA